jgi:hypothetical protein
MVYEEEEEQDSKTMGGKTYKSKSRMGTHVAKVQGK